MRDVLVKTDVKELKIRLHRMIYPVESLGYGRRLGIWMQGCSKHCPCCISPEMKRAEQVPAVPLWRILEQMPPLPQCDGMTISGGEPLDQPEALLVLMDWFSHRYGDDILIYTGYEMDQLPSQYARMAAQRAAAVAAGPYQRELDFGVGLCGSENQHLVVHRHQERYQDFEHRQRTLQPVTRAGRLLLVGIPPREGGVR